MGSVAKLFTQNILWRVCYYLISFVLTLSIARHFEAATSGNVFYLINNCSFLVLLLSLSFEAAIVYFGSNKQISNVSLFNISIILVLLAGFFMLIGLISNQFFFHHRFVFREFKYATLFILGNMLSNFMAGFYFARRDFVTPNIISIVISGLMLLLLYLTKENTWLDNSQFVSLYFFSFFIQGFIMLLLYLKTTVNGYKFDFLTGKEFSKLYHYLSLVFLGNLLTFFCYRMDYWFIKYYCSSIELGNYIQVSKLVQLFFILPSMLATVLFPLTSGGEQERVKSLLPIITRSVFFVYTLLSFFLVIIGNWLFPFLFGASFDLMYVCFLFYIPGMIAFSGLYAFTSFYSGQNRVLINLKGCSIALIIALAGDCIFIPRFGINGAAAVSSCAYFIYFVFVMRVFIKDFQLPIIDFILFRKKDWIAIKSLLKQNP